MNTTLQRSLPAIILGILRLALTAVLVETLEYFAQFGPHTDTLAKVSSLAGNSSCAALRNDSPPS